MNINVQQLIFLYDLLGDAHENYILFFCKIHSKSRIVHNVIVYYYFLNIFHKNFRKYIISFFNPKYRYDLKSPEKCTYTNAFFLLKERFKFERI